MTEVVKLPIEMVDSTDLKRGRTKLVVEPKPVPVKKKPVVAPDPKTGDKLSAQLSDLQARYYDRTTQLAASRDKLHDTVAELVEAEGKRYDVLIIEHGRTSGLMAALSDEMVEIESRIHDTELAQVDFELSTVTYKISGLLMEARKIRNDMEATTAELRPLLAPRSGSGHSKQILDLKTKLSSIKHAAQVNGKELYKAKLREEELTERRNELMDVKPEPIPEPGSKSYAHLYPI